MRAITVISGSNSLDIQIKRDGRGRVKLSAMAEKKWVFLVVKIFV
jgi:hypothetical protein